MDFATPYEALGDQRFQLFCQSLLSYEFPEVQSLPINQPDGGRDAFTRVSRAQMSVFQVKFVRRPEYTADPEEWVSQVLTGERAKIARLEERGLTKYYLLTNAPGSAHLDKGTVDKVQTVLDRELPVPATCWWRNDLDVRLAKHRELKWSYRELLTGSDVLDELVGEGLSEHRTRRTNAIKAFLSAQYDVDKTVRFKQVDLQNELLNLFVDVPVTIRRRRPTQGGHNSVRGSVVKGRRIMALDDDDIGAATLLLTAGPEGEAQQFVVDGAPGQGKSTLAQYLCQVHRMRLLRKKPDLRRVPAQHADAPISLPFKVDLRDLASFVGGEDPFASLPQWGGLPAAWPRSLEGFLAAQVRLHSGGADFDVSDLLEVARTGPLVIVLDGLDEVANISARRQTVETVTTGIAALRGVCETLQVVVTSRPAAFANSPGFSPDAFQYLSLGALTLDLIMDYTERWAKARKLGPDEAREVLHILDTKLDEPHMRDLARNPMQLAILLSLINTKGESLPDKRTELYSAYMGLFFDREASKSSTVRQHRELLYGLHALLGWRLHLGAERASSGGTISRDDLEDQVGAYMVEHGIATNLKDDLFQGVVERIIALVAVKQDLFEFEVQPLREFFAAQYLYDTAQVARFGDLPTGTQADRFDALARSPFWLNVARFFAGFYTSGELASLADRLEALDEDDKFRLTDHPRMLAAMLLADWSFSLDRRSRERAIALITNGLGVRHALASASEPYFIRISRTRLPAGSGREEVADRAFSLMESDLPADRKFELTRVLTDHAPADQLAERWVDAARRRRGAERTDWFRWGGRLGVFGNLEGALLRELIDTKGSRSDVRDRVRELAVPGGFRFLETDEVFSEQVVDDALGGRLDGAGPQDLSSHLGAFVALLELGRQAPFFRYDLSAFAEELPTEPPASDISTVGLRCANIVEEFKSQADERSVRRVGEELWSGLIERSREAWGERLVLSAVGIALVAGRIRPRRSEGTSALVRADEGLVARIRDARLRSGRRAGKWWRAQADAATTSDEKWLVATAASLWASGEALEGVLDFVSETMDGCELKAFALAADSFRHARFSGALRDPGLSMRAQRELSPRVAVLVIRRSSEQSGRAIYEQRLARYRGRDEAVLNHCAAMEIGANANWQKALALARRAYRYGVVVQFDDGFLGARATGMSLELARTVVERPRNYPFWVVNVAELTCRRYANGVAARVEKVARQERWFADQARTSR